MAVGVLTVYTPCHPSATGRLYLSFRVNQTETHVFMSFTNLGKLLIISKPQFPCM